MNVTDRSLCLCGHTLANHEHDPDAEQFERGCCTINLGVRFDRGRDLKDTNGFCPCQGFELDETQAPPLKPRPSREERTRKRLR